MWKGLGLSLVFAIAVSTAPFEGEQYVDEDEYIIGGRPSEKGRWPWVVSLSKYRPDEGIFRHTCGASLLTPEWLLTAAHCVEEPEEFYEVYVGAFDISKGDQEDTVNITRIIKHEDFNISGDGIPNDIAVVQLARPVDISNVNIGLGKLPRQGEDFAGNPNCWVAGWGRYNPHPDNWTSSPFLREVNTEVHTNEECKEIWNDFLNGTDAPILDQHICIGLPDKGACHGDSGSSANCDVTGNGDWVMVGLNSWGTGDRCAAATNAFVRVTYFLDWITEKVSGLPGNKPPQPPEE